MALTQLLTTEPPARRTNAERRALALEAELRSLLGSGARFTSEPVTGLRRVEVGGPAAVSRIHQWARERRIPVTTPLITRGGWRSILRDTDGRSFEVLARLR